MSSLLTYRAYARAAPTPPAVYFFGWFRWRRSSRIRSCSANSRRFSSTSDDRFGLAARFFCLAARRSLMNACAPFSQSGCTGLPRLGPCSRLTHIVRSGRRTSRTRPGPRRRGAGAVFRAAFAARVTGDAGNTAVGAQIVRGRPVLLPLPSPAYGDFAGHERKRRAPRTRAVVTATWQWAGPTGPAHR